MPKISLKTGKAIKNLLAVIHNQKILMIVRRLFCFVVLILTACQTSTPAVKPIVTPQIWQTQLTPDLQWLEPGLNLCTNQQVGLGLATFERPASVLDNHQVDITLRWGAPEHLTGYAVVLAYDELVVAVNSHNPVQSLSQKDIQAIYSGKLNNWKNLKQSITFDQKIQTWGYEDGEETQQVFASALVKDFQPGAIAGFAPAPLAMRQAVAADPGAIGYIPQRWLDQSFRKVNLTDGPTNMLRIPILAITNSEPTQQQKLWLSCLQSTLQP
jgi:hypothetical protein